MSRAGPRRGPGGAAPLPPAWLARADLPISTVPAGTTLHRVHPKIREAVFFGPGRNAAGKREPPLYRFDSASGRFGVLYAAKDLPGALVETLLRNPERHSVPLKKIVERSATGLECARDLRFVQLHGPGLQRVGADNSISTGPYAPCGRWADALWDHRDCPDGIEYLSRHDPGQVCWAIFERPSLRFRKRTTTELQSRLREVAAILQTYRKSVSPD
jgi:hypothetical protein